MGGEEMRFVKEAFESNYIAPLGPQVDAFEREFAEYVGIPYTVALSSVAMEWGTLLPSELMIRRLRMMDADLKAKKGPRISRMNTKIVKAAKRRENRKRV